MGRYARPREGCGFACERTGASELMHSELASSANARALERYAIHADNMMRCQIVKLSERPERRPREQDRSMTSK